MILLTIIVSVSFAIFGTYIGLWLANNFSFYKLIKFIKREKPKYLF